MASHPPVPISELADHIERLKANDNLKFSQEYEVGMLIISPWNSLTWEITWVWRSSTYIYQWLIFLGGGCFVLGFFLLNFAFNVSAVDVASYRLYS